MQQRWRCLLDWRIRILTRPSIYSSIQRAAGQLWWPASRLSCRIQWFSHGIWRPSECRRIWSRAPGSQRSVEPEPGAELQQWFRRLSVVVTGYELRVEDWGKERYHGLGGTHFFFLPFDVTYSFLCLPSSCWFSQNFSPLLSSNPALLSTAIFIIWLFSFCISHLLFFFSSVISKGLSLPGDFLLMLLCRVIFFLFHAREKRKVGMIFILIFTFYLFFFLLDKRHSWRYHFWAYGAGNSSLSSSLSLLLLLVIQKKACSPYDDDYEFLLSCALWKNYAWHHHIVSKRVGLSEKSTCSQRCFASVSVSFPLPCWWKDWSVVAFGESREREKKIMVCILCEKWRKAGTMNM